jgi:alkylated DNA repair dioxygenase AlkB
LPRGLYYDRNFVSRGEREAVLDWLSTIYPIWEYRYSTVAPLPEGREQRMLLRPVYWLGNWQFACLDYYHPPKGILNRCVKAEPFPPAIAKMIERIEKIARAMYRAPDLPARWHLNTCLVNFYGKKIEAGRAIDTARVGEHKDFEPGPVASVSLGERAMFQFVSSRRPGTRDAVEFQQWLDDGSLQIFGGERWKSRLFHRVQRVDRKTGKVFPLNVEGFETRRINFTFRYVPDEHILPYSKLPFEVARNVEGYVMQLSQRSKFFAAELAQVAAK